MGAANGPSVLACLYGCDYRVLGALLFQVCPASPRTGFRSLQAASIADKSGF